MMVRFPLAHLATLPLRAPLVFLLAELPAVEGVEGAPCGRRIQMQCNRYYEICQESSEDGIGFCTTSQDLKDQGTKNIEELRAAGYSEAVIRSRYPSFFPHEEKEEDTTTTTTTTTPLPEQHRKEMDPAKTNMIAFIVVGCVLAMVIIALVAYVKNRARRKKITVKMDILREQDDDDVDDWCHRNVKTTRYVHV